MIRTVLFATSMWVLIGGAVAQAALMPCGAPPPPALTVDTRPPDGPSDVVFNCGGLTFSGFEAVDAGNASPVVMNLVGANWDPSTGWVYLDFNPNMSTLTGGNVSEDIWFFFNVTGGVRGVDLTVGGSNASILERVCADGVARVGAGNNCLPITNTSVGTPLAQMAAGSNGRQVVDWGFYDDSIYIFKDILVENGKLTSFSQSFHGNPESNVEPIPEPGTMALLGSSLVGLALMLRRRR